MDILFILITIIIATYLLHELKIVGENTIVPNLIDFEEKVEEIKGNQRNQLTRLLNDISSADKVVLKEVTEKWSMNKDVMDTELNEQLIDIISKVINSIGGIIKHDFFVKNVENAYVMKDKDGNYRCIMSCFIYDIHKYYTVKLVLDVVNVSDQLYFNFIDIDESGVNNILNRYDVRWQSQGILANYDMFDENTKVILDNYYNSNYEILYLDNESTNDVSGTFTLQQLMNNYLPANTPLANSPVFCKKYSNEWNSYGIPEKVNNNCLVNNNRAGSEYPNIPYNAPGVVVQRTDANQYSWIKDPVRGNINYN